MTDACGDRPLVQISDIALCFVLWHTNGANSKKRALCTFGTNFPSYRRQRVGNSLLWPKQKSGARDLTSSMAIFIFFLTPPWCNNHKAVCDQTSFPRKCSFVTTCVRRRWLLPDEKNSRSSLHSSMISSKQTSGLYCLHAETCRTSARKNANIKGVLPYVHNV